jgi:hypothetical protein
MSKFPAGFAQHGLHRDSFSMGVASFQRAQSKNLLTNLSLKLLRIFFLIVLEYSGEKNIF